VVENLLLVDQFAFLKEMRALMKDQIIVASKSAKEFEGLYRSDSSGFEQSFPGALAECPESVLLQAWHQRLFFEGRSAMGEAGVSRGSWDRKDLFMILGLVLIFGTLLKLPQFISSIDEELFYPRNIGGIFAGALMGFFCFQRQVQAKVIIVISSLLVLSLICLNLLPDPTNSDTSALACLHLSFAFWFLIGVAFVGGAWKDLPGRMNFVRYNGELLIFGTVIMIGGMVLTGLTIGLFELIGLSIGEWYMNSVGVYGAVAVPLVATLLITRIVNGRFRMDPLLAKVFTPLFRVMVLIYLAAMVVKSQSPFTDREFLMAFNGLLLVVLGLCVFSISERGTKVSAGPFDLMNIGLVSVTLLIDLVALSAIVFRLSSYGFTPNRVAVLGANLLAFCHLAGILFFYFQFIRGKSSCRGLEDWIVRFLPAYTIWSLIVAVLLPLLFQFA
jgi:hypothetical protein